jgi:uncharacterized membrane protein
LIVTQAVGIQIDPVSFVEPWKAISRSKERSMKPLSWAGILAIVLGALILFFQGITYNKKKNVLDIGGVHVTTTQRQRIDLPPVVGGLVILGGIVLLVAGSRQKA